MNYVAEKLAEFKGISNRIFKNTRYDLWFLKVKPYLDSIGVDTYVLKSSVTMVKIELPNGGVIKFSKGGDINSVLDSLIADDDAIIYLYPNVRRTHIKGMLYSKEKDSSTTFILNIQGEYKTINLTNMGAYVHIGAVLKGLSAVHLSGKPVSGYDRDYVEFFHSYLKRDNKEYGVCTLVSFIVRAFGDFRIESNIKGKKLVRAGSFIICEWTDNELFLKERITKWILDRISIKDRTLIDFI